MRLPQTSPPTSSCGSIAASLRRRKTIAFDTEFVSEHTYRPVLCLIQVAADGELAVIDAIDRRRRDAVLGGRRRRRATRRSSTPAAARWSSACRRSAAGRRGCSTCRLPPALAGAEYPAGLGTLISQVSRPDAAEARNPHRLAPPPALEAAGRIRPERRPLPAAAARHDLTSKLSELGRLDWLAEEMDVVARGSRAGDVAGAVAAGVGQRGARRPRRWPSSASCSTGATPRPSAAISPPAASSATT